MNEWPKYLQLTSEGKKAFTRYKAEMICNFNFRVFEGIVGSNGET